MTDPCISPTVSVWDQEDDSNSNDQTDLDFTLYWSFDDDSNMDIQEIEDSILFVITKVE